MLRKVGYYGLLSFPFIFFVLFFFLPVLHVVRGGFLEGDGSFTLFYVTEVFRNPIYAEGLLNSFKIALGTTLVSLLIALPLAWLSDRYDFYGKKLLTGALLLPMILAPFVGARIMGSNSAPVSSFLP